MKRIRDQKRAKRIRDQKRAQRKLDRQRVTLLVKAVQNGDCESFCNNLTADMMPWEEALRRFAKLRDVPIEFQQAFQNAWIQAKNASLKVNNRPAICAGLRVMFPPYAGPAVRLFRGADFNEVKRRQYGLSWTDDRTAAERFARNYSEMPNGGVILETIALRPQSLRE